MRTHQKALLSVRTFIADVMHGFAEITHSSFALLGLAVVFATITLVARPDLQRAGEERLVGWLLARQETQAGYAPEPSASERATASNPKELPHEQAAVTYWLSKKYRIAPEPLAVLVAEAYDIGSRIRLDPTLILAVMAVESRFNPFAQSSMGAQGLMQVMTRVHTDKYEDFGGRFAAFDPVANLRVGVKVLQECIARAGSIDGGLRAYVGATNPEEDGGYASKVMAEHLRLRQVAGNRAAPAGPMLSTKAAPAPAATPPAGQKVAMLSPF